MKAANSHDRPILDLRPTGDVRALARVIARVLVRRELIFAGVIPEQDDCDNRRAAG